MAKLIVERPTLINYILPQEGGGDERLDLVLCSMCDMFYSYLQKAQQPHDGYIWVSLGELLTLLSTGLSLLGVIL